MATVHFHSVAVPKSARVAAVGANVGPVGTRSSESANEGHGRMGVARPGAGIAGHANGQIWLARLVSVPADAGLACLFVRHASPNAFCAGLCGLERDAIIRGAAREALRVSGFHCVADPITPSVDLNTPRPPSTGAQLAPIAPFNLSRNGAGMAASTLVIALRLGRSTRLWRCAGRASGLASAPLAALTKVVLAACRRGC